MDAVDAKFDMKTLGVHGVSGQDGVRVILPMPRFGKRALPYSRAFLIFLVACALATVAPISAANPAALRTDSGGNITLAICPNCVVELENLLQDVNALATEVDIFLTQRQINATIQAAIGPLLSTVVAMNKSLTAEAKRAAAAETLLRNVTKNLTLAIAVEASRAQRAETALANLPFSRYIFVVTGDGSLAPSYGQPENSAPQSTELYDVLNNTWVSAGFINDVFVSGNGIVAIRSLRAVYAVGGTRWATNKCPPSSGSCNPGVHYTIDSEIVQKYDVSTKTWSRVANLTSPQVVSAAELDDSIFALGQCFSNTLVCPLFQRYDPVFDRWTILPLPNIPRLNGAALSSLNGYMYVVGGHVNSSTGLCCVPSPTAERYDPSTNQWTQISSMSVGRTAHSVVAMNGYLYAIGGQGWTFPSGNDTQTFSTVERYDPLRDVWQSVASMKSKRVYLGAVALNGFLYVMGGSLGSALNTVERYDPGSNQWTFVKSMNTPRNDFGACVLPF